MMECCAIVGGHLCDVLNVHALTEDKSDSTKASFYKELVCVFEQFLKYHMKILIGGFSAKVGREDIFRSTVMNESLHEMSYDDGVIVVNFATSKNLNFRSTMSLCCSINKYAWTYTDGKMHIRLITF
jgi:hypothetical protein